MKINPCNNSTNFNGSLKIYSYINAYSPISVKEIEHIENGFKEMTKSKKGHLDVIIYDRYNSSSAKPDRILYSDGEYMDYIDTYFKHTADSDVLIKKLVSVFDGFKKIKKYKESIKTTF